MTPFCDLLASPASQISGRRCQQHVARLSQMHRIIGSPGYQDALDYVHSQLTSLGLTDIVVERFPMNGARAYGDWIAPAAWEARAAELWVESPERFRLCDYAETPVCLHVGSQSSSSESVVGELVDVGGGVTAEDYEGQEVADRIVLTSGNVRDVYEEAVRRRGARGIISDGMPWQSPGIGRSPLDQPDLVSYNKLNVRHDEINRDAFSFGISARQGERLRHLMRQGPVRVRAVVDARASSGELAVLNARIPGSEHSEGELVLVTHLCHPQPGANDNATGPALILDLVRSLLAAQQRSASPILRHSLRLLFVPEAYGTIAWLLESEAPRDEMLFALNLDMVGGDSAQTRGHLWLDQTPWSVPTYLNDLVAGLLAETAEAAPDNWQYGVREHMGGSDHIMFLAPDVGVPAIMLGHEPDLFYHSNQDTVDKTSPREFEKVGRVVMTTLLAADRITPERARALAHLVYRGAIHRIVDYGQQTVQRALADGRRRLGDYRTAMQILLAKEQAALSSLVPHTSGESKKVAQVETSFLTQRLADACALQLTVMAEALGPSQPRPEDSRDRQVPRRLFQGPISSHLMGLSRFLESLGSQDEFYRARTQEDRTFVRWMFEASNLIDGRRTLCQIQDTLMAEIGQDAARVEDLHRFVDDLVSVGMADLV